MRQNQDSIIFSCPPPDDAGADAGEIVQERAAEADAGLARDVPSKVN